MFQSPFLCRPRARTPSDRGLPPLMRNQLLSTSSMHELNHRLPEPVALANFRWVYECSLCMKHSIRSVIATGSLTRPGYTLICLQLNLLGSVASADCPSAAADLSPAKQPNSPFTLQQPSLLLPPDTVCECHSHAARTSSLADAAHGKRTRGSASGLEI